jgi:3-oxoacyl-ACP reductase-like protein
MPTRTRTGRRIAAQFAGPAASLPPTAPTKGSSGRRRLIHLLEEAMNDSPILKDKHAVVFGAGGSIGAAVARQFSADGAEVFLAGRTKSSLDAVTRQTT